MIQILTSAHDQPAPSSARVAIVTFLIGEVYERTWSRMCARSWTSYAQRIGADIIVLKDRIDASDVSRSPAWQKLLILDLPWAKRYERILWLDSDIIINDEAPDILQYGGPVEKVGICEDSGHLSPAEAQVYLESRLKIQLSPHNVQTSWRTAMRERYATYNTPPHDVMFNTGVLVLSPAHHNEALKSVYSYPQISQLYEQPRLSHSLLEHDLVYTLSPRYNWGIMEPIELIFNKGRIGDETPEFMAQIIHVIVRSQLNCAYFLHFYGAMNLLKHYADTMFHDAPDLATAAE
jgi:lipopolysaccharide biosynthesis glycosyltransferase